MVVFEREAPLRSAEVKPSAVADVVDVHGRGSGSGRYPDV
jgi:hypothetical protein